MLDCQQNTANRVIRRLFITWTAYSSVTWRTLSFCCSSFNQSISYPFHQ